MRVVPSAILVTLLAALTGYALLVFDTFERADGFFLRSDAGPLLLCTALAWLLFAAAMVALRRVPDRLVRIVVLGGALLIGVAALLGPPNTSTDSARYAWDGIVQKAGISPYAFTPADPALADLRPDWLFPPPAAGETGGAACPGERIVSVREVGTGETICTALNRPAVPTIYPPLAEIYFLVVRLFVPSQVGYLAFQVAGLVVVLAVTFVLLRALRSRGLDPRWAALWGWSPIVASEAITNSHVDVLGAALALVATLLVARGRRVRGGIALGAAISAKLIPVIVAPALLRRHPLPIALAAIGTFALLYVPYVLGSGIGVLGYLPGYLSEEGYEDGSRFALVPPFVPGPIATLLVALVVAVVAVLVLLRTDPTSPWVGQTVMVGATLLAVSPRYAWYALLLVPFIAMSGRWEWFAVALALGFRMLAPPGWAFSLSLVVAIAVVVAGWAIRRRRDGRPILARRHSPRLPLDKPA